MPFVQSVREISASDVSTPTITGVTGGNALIVVVIQTTAVSTRTYTVASDVDGSFGSPVKRFNPNRIVEQYIKFGVTAGTHTVTVTASGATNFDVRLIEVSGLDSGGTAVSGDFNDGGVDVNDHFCAASGSIDTTTGTFIVCASAISSSTGISSITEGAGYTPLTSSSNLYFVQYGEFASPVTDERGAWSHAGTARRADNIMVAYPLAEGGATAYVTGGWFGR